MASDNENFGTEIKEAFEKVGSFFHSAGVSLSNDAVALFGKPAAHAFGVAAHMIVNDGIGKLALATVQELESVIPVLSGEAKHAQAFSVLANAAKDAGLSVGKSALNLLIETAVQYIKKP